MLISTYLTTRLNYLQLEYCLLASLTEMSSKLTLNRTILKKPQERKVVGSATQCQCVGLRYRKSM